MSWQTFLADAGKERHAETITTKRWKQESGKFELHLFGDAIPAVIGCIVWLKTTDWKQGLLWGGVSWLVGSYIVVPLLTEPWFIGLSNDELDQIVRNFLVSADNRSRIRMSAGKRRFALYCEVTKDDSSFIGLRLPRKHWNDVFDQTMRKALIDAGVQHVYGARKNIYVWGPREPEFVHALLQCVLHAADIPLEQLAVGTVHETTHVFSDEPVKSQYPRQGVEKK